MNKSKIFLLAAVTALAGGALVRVASLSKINNAQFAKASVGDPVAHHITFTNQDFSVWEKDQDSEYVLAELTHNTDNNYPFKTKEFELYTSSEKGIIKGTSSDEFIVKMYSGSTQYKLDDWSYIYIKFDMEVDVEDSVLVTVDYTTHYNDGESESDSKQKGIHFSVDEEAGGLLYELSYNFSFTNKFYEYVTIDSIDVYYSCTY